MLAYTFEGTQSFVKGAVEVEIMGNDGEALKDVVQCYLDRITVDCRWATMLFLLI